MLHLKFWEKSSRYNVLFRLRKIQSLIAESEEKNEEVRSKRKLKKTVEEATAVPALNAHKTPKKEPDFVGPEQLTGDLRNVSGKSKIHFWCYGFTQILCSLGDSKIYNKINSHTYTPITIQPIYISPLCTSLFSQLEGFGYSYHAGPANCVLHIHLNFIADVQVSSLNFPSLKNWW